MDHCTHIYNSYTFLRLRLSLNNLAQIAYIFRKKLLFLCLWGGGMQFGIKNTIIEVLKVKIDRPDTRLRAGAL
jgi:hypothetical protein